MFSFLYSSSPKIGSNGITRLGIKPKVSSIEFKKACVNDEQKSLLQKEVAEKKENIDVSDTRSLIKVKVLMTKEEAARLLSKCKNGGTLNFKDVACELVQIPTSRVRVVSSGSGCRVLENNAEVPLKYD